MSRLSTLINFRNFLTRFLLLFFFLHPLKQGVINNLTWNPRVRSASSSSTTTIIAIICVTTITTISTNFFSLLHDFFIFLDTPYWRTFWIFSEFTCHPQSGYRIITYFIYTHTILYCVLNQSQQCYITYRNQSLDMHCKSNNWALSQIQRWSELVNE